MTAEVTTEIVATMAELTVQKVAGRLHLTQSRVRELLRDGNLEGSKTGRKWLVPSTAVEDYLRSVQPKTPPADGQGPLAEDPAQAERSSHWPELRRIAQDIGNGLFRVYLSQLVGLPWERSQLVKAATGQTPTLELPPDKHDIYRALQEHLPRHLVWDAVNAWLASIPAVLAQAVALKDWVDRQPQYRRLSNRGDGFASMLVYEAAEGPCGLPASAFAWQPAGTVEPSEAWTLQRFRNGSQYADMATGTGPQALEQAKASYDGLKERMGGLDKLRVLAEASNEMTQRELELRRLFTTIAKLARFEGTCHLWTGPAV